VNYLTVNGHTKPSRLLTCYHIAHTANTRATDTATMMRLEKLEGIGSVKMVEAEIPSPSPDDPIVKVKRSLISRGSELFNRYVKEQVVSPESVGYSDAGDVVEVG
jgi:hypothetical protein